jgi:hypothetical protein
MSKVKYMGHVDTEMMEPHLGGDAVYYEQVGIRNPSFACLDVSCGLVWDRKHYAESCEGRGHVSKWSQGYGGMVENGVYKPARTYVRQAIGRLSLVEREPLSHQKV